MISVIIIDYKSMDATVSYMESFIERCMDIEKVNFIVVDNSQEDKNYCKLQEYYVKKQIDFDGYFNEFIDKIESYELHSGTLISIKAKGNYGFAKGNNIGAIISKQFFKDDYVLFSNNDLEFKYKFYLKPLIDIFDIDKKIAVVGPKIIGIDGIPQSPQKKSSIWSTLSLAQINMLTVHWFDKVTSNVDYSMESKYCYWVSGCFMLVDSKKFFEVGLFDENTFLYAEEIILAERLLVKDYLNFFYNDLEIIHNNGQIVKKAIDEIKSCRMSFDSLYYYYKNYRKASKFQLLVGRLSFFIFKSLFPLKRYLKGQIKYTG